MKKFAGLIVLIIIYQNLFAQYTLNGSAAQITCNEYRLTQAVNGQSGSVWNNNKINLNQSFDFKFDVFLGNSSSPGADGIAFVLQPISTSVGTTGGGLGYSGVSPAVGITIDTWQNSDNFDPAYDHITIQLNGDLYHNTSNSIAGPVTAINGNDNIEDGIWHSLRIQWDAATKIVTAYIDGNLRVTATNDFVSNVFAGDPMVFWGFTGSTGGENNYQGFKTALNPSFHFGPAQKRCINEPITFYDSTISFTNVAKFYWNFGDGSPIDSLNLNPVHAYTAAGNYTVVQRVIGADGCEATNTQTVLIGSKPLAGFTMNDNCVLNTIQFTDTSYVTFGTINNWYWDFGNGQTNTNKSPSLNYNTAGDTLVKLVVSSTQGCQSDTLFKTIHIFGRPVVDYAFTDSVCLGTQTNFSGTLVSATDPVLNWGWNFGDTSTVITNTQNASYTFSAPGMHNVIFMATSNGSAGCMGMQTKSVFVVDKPRAAIKIITACENKQLQLLDSSYTTDGLSVSSWWWDLGNGQFSNQQNPLVTYTTAGPKTIKLVVRNTRNCSSDTITSTINIESKPVAKFSIDTSLCNNSAIQFFDSSFVNNASISQWEWISNNSVFSTQQNASGIFNAGPNSAGLWVTSNFGCKSDTVFQSFVVKSKPLITMNFKDTCKQSPVSFSAAETGSNIGIVNWNWDFGDGSFATTNPATHVYRNNNKYTVKLYGISTEGCSSDTLQDTITIYGTNAFAGNDIIAAANQPVQLNASGGLSYVWSPSTGLSDVNIPNPVATNSMDRNYYLKAFTPEGCESFDTINIKIYKGPEIYVPSAFTPNGDGKNDVLKALPVGISSFEYFAVYNRYGQLIFKTSNYSKGWDGTVSGKAQDTGNFVWMASAVDFMGNKMFKKGTVLLIR